MNISPRFCDPKCNVARRRCSIHPVRSRHPVSKGKVCFAKGTSCRFSPVAYFEIECWWPFQLPASRSEYLF